MKAKVGQRRALVLVFIVLGILVVLLPSCSAPLPTKASINNQSLLYKDGSPCPGGGILLVLSLDRTQLRAHEELWVKVEIKNTGSRALAFLPEIHIFDHDGKEAWSTPPYLGLPFVLAPQAEMNQSWFPSFSQPGRYRLECLINLEEWLEKEGVRTSKELQPLKAELFFEVTPGSEQGPPFLKQVR